MAEKPLELRRFNTFDADFPPIQHVRERDIDLLLLEELRSTPEFRAEFLRLLNEPALADAEFSGAYHNVKNSQGQTDLAVDFRVAGKKWRVYVENKIDADFQPRQIERYEERAHLDQKRHVCDFYLIVLVAPANYPIPLTICRSISYQSICSWFHTTKSLGERSHYKIELLQSAISKGARLQAANVVANEFHLKYWNYCQHSAPELRMTHPGIKSGGFIHFHPSSLPDYFKFIHKLWHGNMDLQLRGMGNRLDEVREAFGPFVAGRMKIERANQSAVIRIQVPQLIREGDFDQQLDKVNKCLDAAKEMSEWLERNPTKATIPFPTWTRNG